MTEKLRQPFKLIHRMSTLTSKTTLGSKTTLKHKKTTLTNFYGINHFLTSHLWGHVTSASSDFSGFAQKALIMGSQGNLVATNIYLD